MYNLTTNDMTNTNNKNEVWDIPSWAVFALKYGIEEDFFLSKDEEDMIRTFIKTNYPQGYVMDVDWKSRTEANQNSAFGAPCETYKVTFRKI